MNPPCAHCGGTRTVERRRGLCMGCYRDPAVRAAHEPRTHRPGQVAERRGLTDAEIEALPPEYWRATG